MNKLVLRVIAIAAIGALSGMPAAAPASASADEGGAATLTNAQDLFAASATAPDPNVTCAVKAAGREINQRVNYAVGEVYGHDFGAAEGECVSFDRSRPYSCTVTVTIEYFIGTFGGWAPTPVFGAWEPTPYTATVHGDASQGVCRPIVPAEVIGTYAGDSPYLNRYHRAHAVITNTIPGSAARHDYSPIWFMAP